MAHHLSRRTFIEAGAAASLAALAGLGQGATAGASPRVPVSGEPWVEADVATLQRLMQRRVLSSVELTTGYLGRIASLDPVLHSVIETNPDAVSIAAARDRERRQGRVRGPLHGIPVLVKDNIATKDRMQTTAGSLALVGSTVAADSDVVANLRRAGAVILGKANLSEWANFRGFAPFNGWSARGGFTRNPYELSLDPTGSSSGSAVAVAASLCAVAVGTETDGSILGPSGEQSLVGIKPTLGLVSQNGIIPIAHSQDTAGPMARTVRDAALLLDTLRVPGRTVMGRRVPSSYAAIADDVESRRPLRGVRIGYDHRYVEGPLGPGDDEQLALLDEALRALRRNGATIVDVTSLDPFEPDETGRIPWDDELVVLLAEFKVHIAEYLATLGNTSMRTLDDLIRFNLDNCAVEMAYYGQELFEWSASFSGDLTDPEYLAAWSTNRNFGRRAIDGVLAQGVDVILAPTFSYATSTAATGGYPSMAVPIGYVSSGRPVGFWLFAGFLQEATLIKVGAAIERVAGGRVAPTLAGSVPPEPPAFDGCAAAPAVARSASKTAPALRRPLAL